MTSWGYCVLVYNCSGEPFVHPDISGTSRIDVVGSEFEIVAPTSEEDVWKGGSRKNLSRLLLRVRFFLIYIVDLSSGQWFIILVFAGDANFAPRVSGRDELSTGVEIDGQPMVRRTIVSRRLVSLTRGFSMTSLKLSTVGVDVGSYWSRLLMMVIIMFKWGIY